MQYCVNGGDHGGKDVTSILAHLKNWLVHTLVVRIVTWIAGNSASWYLAPLDCNGQQSAVLAKAVLRLYFRCTSAVLHVQPRYSRSALLNFLYNGIQSHAMYSAACNVQGTTLP